MNVNESDWKLFRSRLPVWQESYMESRIREYIDLLSGPGAASEKFWSLDKRLKEDKHRVGVIAEMSRSMMNINILNLLADGVIELSDLDGFSEELREKMAFMMRNR